MDYRVFAEDELLNYDLKCIAVKIGKERLRELEMDFESIGGRNNARCNRGAGNRTEERWLNMIINIEDEKERLEKAQKSIERIDLALSALPEEQKRILKALYFDEVHMTPLAKRENVSMRTLYRMKDKALMNFTRAYFGAVIT